LSRPYTNSSDDNGDDIAHPITVVSNERDLGVTFDRDLKFTDHIHIIVQKENNVLGIIKCTFTRREANAIRQHYSRLPNFRLLFHCLESSPFKEYPKARISPERATKLIPSLYDLSYSERLQRLNLPSLL